MGQKVIANDDDDFCHVFYSSGSGARFSKVPRTFRARKAISKTATRLFCKASLLICCKGNTV